VSEREKERERERKKQTERAIERNIEREKRSIFSAVEAQLSAGDVFAQ